MAGPLKRRPGGGRKSKPPDDPAGVAAAAARVAALRRARQAPPLAAQAAAPAHRRATSSLGYGLAVTLVTLIFGGVLLFLSPGFVFLAVVGLAPTFSLLVLENDWVWSHLGCLVMTNSAGVVLAFGFLWHAGGGLQNAFNLLGNPNIWVLMYGGAALGYGLAWSIPLLMQGLVELGVMRHRTQIEKARKELREEWSVPEDL